MGLDWLNRSAAALGVAASLIASAAEAAGDDCRTVPVYSAHCFQLQQPHAGCAPIPRAAAPCFAVRGRLAPSNGAPALRLWIAGSKRILGVLAGDGDFGADPLTPALRTAMTPPTPGSIIPVTGVFRVCPLASERSGWMRPVCLVSSTQVHVIAGRPVPFDPPPTLVGQQE